MNACFCVGKWQCSVNWIHTIWSDVLLFPPSKIFQFSPKNILHKNINIIFPFRLQPITYDDDSKYHHVFISYGGLDSQLKSFLIFLYHTELWLLSFPSLAFCSLLHISTGHVYSTSHRKLSTGVKGNDGCAKLFNENNDHVIKV
jgi:hypothetical protein